jgi:hypothetical protein
MASATLQVIDGEILAQALEGLPPAIARGIGRSALREGGGPMVAAIKARIHSVTGLLGGGLRLRSASGDRPGRIAVLISSTTTRQTFATKGRRRKVAKGGARDPYRVYYGPMVEFGHKVAGSSATVPAYPFVRPGFEATVDAAGQAIEESIWSGLESQF